MSGQLAANLPYHALTAIFSYAVDVPREIKPHGGRLMDWDSNESIASLALVCKGWAEAASTVLYRSVALLQPGSGKRFLNTLHASPSLAGKVRYLVLSLGEETASANEMLLSPEEYLASSLDLVAIIQRCSATLTHLQLHPIHAGAREPLFAALHSMSELSTLVCSPRFCDPDGDMIDEEHEGGWGANLYSRTDLRELALPDRLRTLELDFASSWDATVLPLQSTVPTKRLKQLRLRCDTNVDVLWAVLAQCSELEVCELYFESMLPRDETTAALRPSAVTLKHLEFFSNPTLDDLAHFDSFALPIFDRLLPYYSQLEHLAVSATEVSTNVFRLLPPTLTSLEIQAFNHVSTFLYTDQLVEDLREPMYAQGLSSLRVNDAAEAWEGPDIQSLREACEARGIDFIFRPDSDPGFD
ncbi:hypothetical protein JCM8097_003713 [Rhodosporidiobolus ruineniae]